MAKFAPLALVPLYVVGERGLVDRWKERPRWPAAWPVVVAGVAFAVATAVLLAHPAIDPGLATFWERTVESQLDRESPFSVWGQVTGSEAVQRVVLVVGAGIALVVAFTPRRRTLAQSAALAAGILIATPACRRPLVLSVLALVDGACGRRARRRAIEHLGSTSGLITRRSWVQIPPPIRLPLRRTAQVSQRYALCMEGSIYLTQGTISCRVLPRCFVLPFFKRFTGLLFGLFSGFGREQLA